MKSTACFGELLLRLSAPGRELLLQNGQLDVHVGGAEANVAVGLARLGHPAKMISVVPDTALGNAAINALRGHGVDCASVQTRDGRMGLYFLTPGASVRAPEVIYDRSYSSFALTPADLFDWQHLLVGVGRLHLSGITPALGSGSLAAVRAAASAARNAGIELSFDCNYRPKLWQSCDDDPKSVLGDLIGHSDILLGNHHDISLLLGKEFAGNGSRRRRDAAEAAFAHFTNLKVIASTARHVEDADRHRISARIDTPDSEHETEEIAVSGIVDRIGTGDAFAVGVLHGLTIGASLDLTARYGLGLACLKHSLPGDASLFGRADLDAFLAGALEVRR